MGYAHWILRRLCTFVDVFAFAIQLGNRFEFLWVFIGILCFPCVKTLASASAMVVYLKDVALKLIYTPSQGLYLVFNNPELVCSPAGHG